MTEKQFLDLCTACRSILQLPDSSTKRVAIPWMHPIREHPIALERYEDIFQKPGWTKRIKKRIKSSIIYTGIWLRQVYRAISRGKHPWNSNDRLSESIDCLFISHVVNPSYLENPDDFYFATIPGELAKKNYKVLVGYLHNLGPFNKNIKNRTVRSVFSKLYFTDTLSLNKELTIRKSLRKEAGILKQSARETTDLLLKQIYTRASREILSGEAQASLRIFEQVKELVTRVNPKTIIIPYEGHAYERICFAAARSVNPKITCISYQHTGIFRLSNAIRQTLAEQYNPNIILAPGNETKEELRKLPAFTNIRIEVLGSIRGTIGVHVTGIRSERKQQACLVMPEGIMPECLLLFKFSVQCAYLRPDINFIWRLHPSVTFDEILSQDKIFAHLPSNIIFSSDTLENDIEACNWVLYRGTTAILKAISAGLRPFYLQIPNELTIDPLHKLNKWRVNITKPEELINWMTHDINTDFIDFPENLPIAMAICDERFSKLDIDVLDNILKEYTSNVSVCL